jgi:hypothetical protein
MIFRDNSLSGCCVDPDSCMVSLPIFSNTGFAYVASHAIFGIIATRTQHLPYFIFYFETSKHIDKLNHTSGGRTRASGGECSSGEGEADMASCAAKAANSTAYTHTPNNNKEEHTQNKHTYTKSANSA